MIKYKLTDQDLRTHGGYRWKVGVERVIEKPGTELCSDQVFHFYDGPELAVLLNPIHADIENPRLWEVECDQVAHDEIKGGAKRMRLVRELPVPQVTMEQTVRFAILCAKKACHDPQFVAWADGWLSGGDRSKEAAAEAARAAWAARAATSWAATRAAWAAEAAWVARAAAGAAAEAARAARANKKIDLIALAQEACRTS
jgi:hypothetical protein